MSTTVDRPHWFQTFTGRKVYVAEPDPSVVDIHDIAHALSMLPRWGGHCVTFYSIAEHDVRLSRLLPSDLKMIGLLRDAAKAYVGELTRPTKRLPQMDGWRDLRDKWSLAIGQALGLGIKLRFPPKLIAEYDERLTHAERRDHLTDGPAREAMSLPMARCVGSMVNDTWYPPRATSEFLSAFEEYSQLPGIFDDGNELEVK